MVSVGKLIIRSERWRPFPGRNTVGSLSGRCGVGHEVWLSIAELNRSLKTKPARLALVLLEGAKLLPSEARALNVDNGTSRVRSTRRCANTPRPARTRRARRCRWLHRRTPPHSRPPPALSPRPVQSRVARSAESFATCARPPHAPGQAEPAFSRASPEDAVRLQLLDPIPPRDVERRSDRRRAGRA